MSIIHVIPNADGDIIARYINVILGEWTRALIAARCQLVGYFVH